MRLSGIEIIDCIFGFIQAGICRIAEYLDCSDFLIPGKEWKNYPHRLESSVYPGIVFESNSAEPSVCILTRFEFGVTLQVTGEEAASRSITSFATLRSTFAYSRNTLIERNLYIKQTARNVFCSICHTQWSCRTPDKNGTVTVEIRHIQRLSQFPYWKILLDYKLL